MSRDAALPVRGRAVRELGLPLPAPGVSPLAPAAPRMPLVSRGRLLKRWRYVAAFGPELMLCAGDVRIGPARQRFWAVAEPGAPLVERTSLGSAGLALGSGDRGDVRLRIESAGVRVDLEVVDGDGAEPVEVASPSGAGGWIWTRKQAGSRARGFVELSGRRRRLELGAVIDDSAGYHARRTDWRWTAGVGHAVSGERLAWNLVSGVHDAPDASERTLWIDGRPAEVGQVRFSPDLSGIALPGGRALEFSTWAGREHRTNLLFIRSSYRAPFGAFRGELPGGLRLAEGHGVMEQHMARW